MPILTLDALKDLSKLQKRAFVLRFNRAVEIVIKNNAKGIEAKHEFSMEDKKYKDSLILAVYLELTSPQNLTTANLLKKNNFPVVEQLLNGQ